MTESAEIQTSLIANGQIEEVKSDDEKVSK
jgi:hypothetical protein